MRALRTSHVHAVAPAQQGTTTGFGGMNGSMGSFGGSFSSSGPKVVKLEYKNTDVLQALVNVTGQNFDYDQDAWKAWYAHQCKTLGLNARRDSQ